MKFLAAVLAVIPGLYAVISDPDALGIGFLVVVLAGLYVSVRTKVTGGIILIGIGALMLVSFFANLLSPAGIAEGIRGILTWIMFVVFPVATGVVFILARRKRLRE